jgi:diguanylate cyclase (GGDEF)-like protein
MITSELQRVISELADVVSQMDDLALACELACDRLQDVLKGPVAILERSGERWRLRSGADAQLSGRETEIFNSSTARRETELQELTARAATVNWAWVPLGGGDARVILVPGEWQRENAAVPLEQTIRQLGFALEAVSVRAKVRERMHLLRSAYAFGRRLSRAGEQAPLYQVIADGIATATRSNVSTLALYSASDRLLRVVATAGYPRVLVEDVRVAPGEGVIGMVFKTRRPLLVADIATVPHLHRRRPRYRTPSFMAVPLLKREQPLGVLCVADRRDGAPFDTDDLRVLRALAPSAALAIDADAISSRAALLAEWATIDPLTGIFNRRYFRQRLEEEFQRARRYDLPLSLLLLDLDDFKSVNDRFGHPAGDAVLRATSDCLRRNVRMFDVCCRYGGEEFVIMLPGGDAVDAAATADRIRQAIGRHPFSVGPKDPPIHMSVSIGVVTLRPGNTVEELIEEADTALYEAKRAGKDQVRIAPTMAAPSFPSEVRLDPVIRSSSS